MKFLLSGAVSWERHLSCGTALRFIECGGRVPRVGLISFGQPWARMRNPVGIGGLEDWRFPFGNCGRWPFGVNSGKRRGGRKEEGPYCPSYLAEAGSAEPQLGADSKVLCEVQLPFPLFQVIQAPIGIFGKV
jgi:hypothetical protein